MKKIPSGNFPRPERQGQGVPVRLQRFLALHSALGSRRWCENLIRSGGVRVNGVVARVGQSVDPAADEVTVDGRRIVPKKAFSYFLYHKPKGVVCTFADSETEKGRRTLKDVLRRAGVSGRLFSVGRLDLDAEGLLILTDDGDLAMNLTHPSREIPRVYEVGLARALSSEDASRLQALRKISPYVHPGAPPSAKRPSPERIRPPQIIRGVGSRHVLVRLKEGRNREVKRIFAEIRHQVTHLRRVAFGSLNLGKLPPGLIRPLSVKEIQLLTKP